MTRIRFHAALAACALATLSLVAPQALAQSLAGRTIVAPAVTVPAVATYCDDGTGHTAICASGGGGGDASAANQTSVQALPGSDATKAIAVQGVTGGKAVKVDGSAVTQPVSAAALPLPSGAATSAKQDTLVTALGSPFQVSGSIGNTVFGAKLQDASGTAFGTNANPVKIDGSAVTQPVSATALPLPTGASTAANQSTLNGYVDGLEGGLGTAADTAWASGSGSAIALLKTIAGGTLDTTTPSPIKIDQTTPGTTNAVSLAQIGSTTTATGNGVVSAGVQRVAIASDNTAFSVNATTTPATTAYALLPATNTCRLLSAAASTNGTSCKASAGAIKSIQGYNAKASAVYLKFYNKASSPTVGTDTPVKTIYLPASSAFVFDFPAGYSFATGIAYALTGAAADADTTALASGDVLALNVDYL